MLLERGNKLLVTHRRLFEGDAARYFLGEVVAYDSGVAKVRGYSFVRDLATARVLRKADPRTKLFSLSSGALIVYQLADEVDVSRAQLVSTRDGFVLEEGGRELMNLSELPRHGHI